MSRPDPAPPPTPSAAAIFAALGDPTRLALLDRMAESETRSIAQLSDGLPISRQGVTKHLRVLEDAGLVTVRKVGRESRYAPRAEPIDAARAYLEQVSARWDAALARLARHIAERPD